MLTKLFKLYPGFLNFWSAQILSTVARQMVVVAMGWQIYDLTHSAMSLGLMGLAQFLPQLTFTLPAGVCADRFNRQRITYTCQFIEAIGVGFIAYGSYNGTLTEGWLYAMACLLGTARAFEFPATQSILPNLVKPDHYAQAMALGSAGREVAVIGGPALGGFLYAVGADWVYGISATCYLVASLSIMQIKGLTQAVAQSRKVTMEVLLGGIAFIKKRPVILGAISLDLFSVLLGGATALLPIFAKDILHTGPWGLGLLRSAPAVGALVMSLYLAKHPLKHHVGLKMFGAVAMFGISTILFGISSWFPLSYVALVLLGASDMVSVVVRTTLVQLETPDEMRGRVSAVNAIFIGTSNELGEFESGLTAHWFGPVAAVVIGGIGTLIVVASWMKLFPALRDRQELKE
ncbi:MFS transporter [Leeia sp. TBRC 13508]|uniref:MFS transporter n=1 Tax=Leeia speluncae TaxID=2884804 RepID=A0ABS8D2Q9_9NEIS|nr:MFS transporter [Leeia speluncae]MCB6182483.1 MFS transporter [Leeia speluncae]